MEKQYYFYNGAEQVGPLSYNELYNRQTTPDMLFWYEGLPGWKKGYEIPELANLFNRTPPPYPGNPQYNQPPFPPPPYSIPQPPPQSYTNSQYSPPYTNFQLQPTPPIYEWYIIVWQKFAQFTGRARRSEYWYFVLFHAIISIALIAFGGSKGGYDEGYYNSGEYGMPYSIYQLAVFIPALAVGVRRMHDVGKSGWFLLIPIYNLILACTEGDRGPNQYGPDPKYA